MIATFLKKDCKSTVKSVLEKDILTRDNSVLLWLKIAKQQIKVSPYPDKPLEWHIVNGSIYTHDNVSRCSRLLQAKHEHLRGAQWRFRQKHSKVVSKQVLENK